MSEKLHPNRLEEDQDMEMEPIVVGPPPFSSDDPATEGYQMIPLEQGTSGNPADTEEAQAEAEADDEDKTVDELKDEAKELEVSGYSTMNKAELQKAVKKAKK